MSRYEGPWGRRLNPASNRLSSASSREEVTRVFRDEDVRKTAEARERALRSADDPDQPDHYYVTPDSAEPLPSGIWEGLDPDVVEGEAKRLEEHGDHLLIGEVHPEVRAALEDLGDLGQQVICLLSSGTAESAEPSAMAVLASRGKDSVDTNPPPDTSPHQSGG
jgi:FMN phosphatase YigB (HAD superfamily)